MSRISALVVAVGVVSLVGCAERPAADDRTAPVTSPAPATTPLPPPPPPDNDNDFITSVAEGGMTEVAIAKLAQTKARNAQVKAFAQRLVRDHTAVNNELMTMARDKNVTLPADADVRVPDEFTSATGAEFDREFISRMIRSHEDSIARFERVERDGRDAEVRAWAAKKLPTLREHLKVAQDLQARISK